MQSANQQATTKESEREGHKAVALDGTALKKLSKTIFFLNRRRLSIFEYEKRFNQSQCEAKK